MAENKSIHQKFMKRAILLAGRGIGWVNPNPMVGAVIVKEGRIIGEGYHMHFGAPHAEVNAFENAREEVSGSTLYVNLEPCSHHGKTPPCTDLIISGGIKKVIIGMRDPNPLVNGKGIEILRAHGIEVVEGIMEEQSKRLNEVFLKYITTGRPFGVLKTAMTLDGKIATVNNASRWISGEKSRAYVHEMRQAYSAIMVGINTVVYDNPLLNIRRKSEGRNPLKVIVDTTCKISLDANVMKNDPQLTLIATSDKAGQGKIKDLERMGAQVLICPLKDDKVDLTFLFDALGKMAIDSVLIEGGSTLAFSVLKEGLVDKVVSFIAPKIIGGSCATSPVGGEGIPRMEDAIILQHMEIRRMGGDILIETYPGKGGN